MRLYRVVIVLGLAAVALGAWELFVQRQTDVWWAQTLLPVLLVAVFAGLYARARKEDDR